MKRKNKKRLHILWIIILLFLTFGTTAVLVTYNMIMSDVESQRAEVESSERLLNRSEQQVISERIDRLTSDLLYIRQTVQLNGLDKEGIERLKRLWIAYSDSVQIYDQIRFLNMNGDEVIRVDYSPDGSKAAAEGDLKNNADRYYFSDSIGLGDRQIYISKLDLYTEDGVITKPYKPMIRLAIPYVDVRGNKAGEVILNYLATDLLQSLKKVAESSHGSTYLLNSDGYWLYNSTDPGSEWGFMDRSRANIGFQYSYPEVWDEITANPEGNITTKDGFFSYTAILTRRDYELRNGDYKLTLDEGDWRVVSHISRSNDEGRLILLSNWEIIRRTMRKTVPAFAGILALSIELALILERNRRKKAKIQYQAEYDELTGVYNRRAGIEKLRTLCQEGVPFSICYLDVNGLKTVNDTLGHDAGDKLIRMMAESVGKVIRGGDSLCRLGGDEFLILFAHTGTEGAEPVWQRIQREIDVCNAKGEQPFILSASHGIAVYEAGDDETSMLVRADKAMYEEKRAYKQEQGEKPDE